MCAQFVHKEITRIHFLPNEETVFVFSLLGYVFSRLKLIETSHGVLFNKIVACESPILDLFRTNGLSKD